jgi:HD superfamily phosphohydrolase
MPNSLRQIPELRELDAPRGLVRIPPELDVPLTPRVRAIVDSEAFQRLSTISQLGLVSLVYPAAHHSRFEHSLGVYRLALMYLRQLSLDDTFVQRVSVDQAERFLVAALLHDVGHWPFCHLIEDLGLPGFERHEALARHCLTEGELAEVLERHWGMRGAEVADLLDQVSDDPASRILQSMISGPIDVDKMDYLMRDSLHAGVPYGRNFDQARLISSLCLNAAGDGIALTEKGRTAIEMMVFARYVMFSEVYWHHTVRSATAMLQRAFLEVHERLDRPWIFHTSDDEFVRHFRSRAEGTPAQRLLDGLFGRRRSLYKRWIQYSGFEDPSLHSQLARQPYARLVDCSAHLAERMARQLGRPIEPHQVLIDAPPFQLEVQFAIDLFNPKEGGYRRLEDLSPVVKTLATTQFNEYVKRVRVFVDPEIAADARGLKRPLDLLQEAIHATA